MDSSAAGLFIHAHFITKLRCCTTSIYTFTNSVRKDAQETVKNNAEERTKIPKFI